MSDTYQRVCKTVGEWAGFAPEEIKPESTTVALGLDSLDEIEIVMSLEDEFNNELPDANLEEVTTIQQLVDLVDKTRAAPKSVGEV
jgi:acyl carrier protein